MAKKTSKQVRSHTTTVATAPRTDAAMVAADAAPRTKAEATIQIDKLIRANKRALDVLSKL